MNSGMSVGPGVYGGVWRDFSAVPTAGWNLCARQTQGWFGINYIYGESLVKSGPMFLRKDNLEPLPNLATDWEWSDDGMTLVMNIIKGAKWSDGHPFGVHDIMFTWNHIILDENVNSWTNRSTWQIGGELTSCLSRPAMTRSPGPSRSPIRCNGCSTWTSWTSICAPSTSTRRCTRPSTRNPTMTPFETFQVQGRLARADDGSLGGGRLPD